MNTNLNVILSGSTAIGLLEATKNIDIEQITKGTGLVYQIVILIVALVAMFKKKKPIEGKLMTAEQWVAHGEKQKVAQNSTVVK